MSTRDDIDQSDLLDVAELVQFEGRESIVTIAEKLRQEGRKDTEQSVVRNMLAFGMLMDQIKAITGLAEEEIEEIKEGRSPGSSGNAT